MRIGLAQLNSTLGDFSGNRRKILGAVKQAQKSGCDLVITPELSLFGYLPSDLLERRGIVEAQLKEFTRLQKEIPAGIGVLVGLISLTNKRLGKPYFNSAALLQKGRKPQFFHKELLPTYDVFDEARHLESGRIRDHVFTFKGQRFLLTICEDIWGWELPDHQSNYLENPLKSVRGKFDMILNMSASPFTLQKVRDRQLVVGKSAKHFKAPMIYVNQVGGQDELIFDGGSFAVNQTGKVLAQSQYFTEDFTVFDLETLQGESRKVSVDPAEKIRGALVLGLRDFVEKTGLERVHFGLSGGVDSAVVACLAVDALGADRVTAITLPSQFNSPESRKLAEKLAANLKIRCVNMPIEKSYETVLETLHSGLGKFSFGLTNENLQARLRGLMLMAFSNKENSLLLTTGNKSEYATGYSTLYGDMCGGLAPIADLLKHQVYALAELYNRGSEVIPKKIITRPPTAELRPNQKDQDSLPPYDELDAAVVQIVEKQKPARTKTEKWVLRTMNRSEFKRWQAPPILKISQHSFGRGRRLPIAHRARD